MNLTNAIFAISLFLTLTFLYFAFRKDPEGNRGGLRLLFASLLFLVLTLGAAWMIQRDRIAARTLEGIITPLPRTSRVSQIPTQQELEMIAKAMRVVSEMQAKVGLPGRFYTVEDYKQLEQQTKQHPIKDLYWIIDTPMTLEEIRQFYLQKENRKEWEITQDSGNFLTLKRGGFTLLIQASKTWYPDKRQVLYRLSGGQ